MNAHNHPRIKGKLTLKLSPSAKQDLTQGFTPRPDPKPSARVKSQGNHSPQRPPARRKGPQPLFIKAAAEFRKNYPTVPLPPILVHNIQNPDSIKVVELGARKTWTTWAKDHGGTKSAQKALTGVLSCMTRSLAYQRAMAADGSQRHDLQGEPTETVSNDHRKQVRVSLKAHYAIKANANARKGNQ